MVLTYERDEGAAATLKTGGGTDTSLDDPVTVVGEFLAHVRSEEASEKEMTLVSAVLNELTAGEEHV
jgi:hypothetical protein